MLTVVNSTGFKRLPGTTINLGYAIRGAPFCFAGLGRVLSVGFWAKPLITNATIGAKKAVAETAIRIAGQILGQEFQSNKPSQFRIFGLVHHAHAAAAQLLQYAVIREDLANNLGGGAIGGMVGRVRRRVNGWNAD
ncbi:MAG TPA: hypothetical protein VKZ53_11765 [Candidatus Angelobacter sp.]|nr:hypothetical protein [Candidatus Angelobacter sp.]